MTTEDQQAANQAWADKVHKVIEDVLDEKDDED
jgi:hypothetical protein